jgi:hypothetical protein
MAWDQVESARDVLRAVSEPRRRGSRAVPAELERQEPDPAEFAPEELSGVHQLIPESGLTPKREHRLCGRTEAMALVPVLALRQAHRRLVPVTLAAVCGPDDTAAPVIPVMRADED